MNTAEVAYYKSSCEYDKGSVFENQYGLQYMYMMQENKNSFAS